MSKVFAKYSSSVPTYSAHHTFVTTAEVGHRHSRPLTTAQGDCKYAVVAVEYVTKWIEAKPLVNIAATGLKRFFW
jgi:transposase InsO family protein